MTSFFFDKVCSMMGKGNAAWVKQCKGLTDLREKMSDQEDAGVCLMNKNQGACLKEKFQGLITGRIGSPTVVQKEEKPAEQKRVVRPPVQRQQGPKVKPPSKDLLVMNIENSIVTKLNNNGETCAYEAMVSETHTAGKDTFEISVQRTFTGSGQVCQRLVAVDKEIDQMRQGFDMMIYGQMILFRKASRDPQKNAMPKGNTKASCIHTSNGFMISGNNDEVCKPFHKANTFEKQRAGRLRAMQLKQIQVIKRGMKMLTQMEEMDFRLRGNK